MAIPKELREAIIEGYARELDIDARLAEHAAISLVVNIEKGVMTRAEFQKEMRRKNQRGETDFAE